MSDVEEKMLGVIIVVIALALFVSGYVCAKRIYEQDSTTTTESGHTKTKIVKVRQPDGSEKTVTVIDSKTDTRIVATTAVKSSKLNLSILAKSSFKAPGAPVYGVSVQKEILGPVAVGAFLYQDSTVGISIGCNF